MEILFILEDMVHLAPTTLDSGNARLSADNWIGCIRNCYFSRFEVEMKQLNLSLGGSRNFSHQFKGIETAGAET